MTAPPVPCPWLPELAEGYLRRFEKVRPLRAGGLWGYRLESHAARGRYGFFVGFFLPTGRKAGAPLPADAPQCAVFAYVGPPGSALHRRLVRAAGGPVRRAYELLTKYTNRRPRFEFHQKDWRALVRRVPLAAFPAGEEEKYARNFFMETLALLLRCGLPEKFAALNASPQRRKVRRGGPKNPKTPKSP
ncbi:MAG: hypothetical protein ACRD4D_00510, partial [Candidatus Acidiferrales bacterium]